MSINLLAEALADYNKALRLGKREGKSLPVLDDILKENKVVYKSLSVSLRIFY